MVCAESLYLAWVCGVAAPEFGLYAATRLRRGELVCVYDGTLGEAWPSRSEDRCVTDAARMAARGSLHVVILDLPEGGAAACDGAGGTPGGAQNINEGSPPTYPNNVVMEPNGYVWCVAEEVESLRPWLGDGHLESMLDAELLMDYGPHYWHVTGDTSDEGSADAEAGDVMEEGAGSSSAAIGESSAARVPAPRPRPQGGAAGKRPSYSRPVTKPPRCGAGRGGYAR